MRHLLIVLALAGVALQQAEPERHDKYRDDPRAYCFHGEAGTAMPGNASAHACQCALMCVTGGDGRQTQGEQSTCEMWCTVSRCLCHADESCALPEVKP